MTTRKPIVLIDGILNELPAADSLAGDISATKTRQLVKNASGATITKGSAVYMSSATGDQVLISLARANTEATSSKTLGLVETDIANGATGYVVTDGLLAGLDTSAAGNDGDAVYLSPTTAGGLVYGLANKPSAPSHLVYLGVVSRKQQNNGSIFIKVSNGWELEELHNVAISSLADSDVLMYDNATTLWKNKVIPAATSLKTATTTVAVNAATAPTAGQVLTAVNNTTATWQTPSSGSVFATDITVNSVTVGKGAGSVSNNTAIGYRALDSNTTGYQNTALGYGALVSNTTGYQNTALGYGALVSNTTGYQNTALGYQAAASTTTVSNEVNIYNGLVTARFQGAAASWSFVSDERDKTNITDLKLGLDFINQLQPREFEWNLRHTDVDKGKKASGFIAQEVLSIVEDNNAMFTGLVDTNDENQFTLAQTNLIPMLVNAIKELTARIEQLESR